MIENVQFFWSGHNYCWYDDGWNGPGWYWCDMYLQSGIGWGGGYGWHHWRGGHPRSYYQGWPRRLCRWAGRVAVHGGRVVAVRRSFMAAVAAVQRVALAVTAAAAVTAVAVTAVAVTAAAAAARAAAAGK